MIPSSADATAAARRIQEPYGQSYARHMDDARLLAGFVLAGDTERLRAALEETAAALGIALTWIPGSTARDSAREIQGRALDLLAEGGV